MTYSRSISFLKKTVICGVLCFSLSGCAGIVIAGLTISELLTAGSIGSALITGKGLGELALDAITGQDCRILEAVFRKDRAICEPEGSIATQDDFKGLIALLDTPAGEQIQLADLPIGKDDYTAVDPKAKAVSRTVLATLTGSTIQTKPGPRLALRPMPQPEPNQKFTDLAHLTKATEKFDPATVPVNAVAKTDLRKRLMGGLF